jgi:hypothetical protein
MFYTSTTISIGNGRITPFWKFSWLNERKSKEISSLIFQVSTRKKWKVEQAICGNAWISKIKLDINLKIPYLVEFISLWRELQNINLREEVEDSITWNLATNREYTSTSPYKAQFFGATHTRMNKMVWKP